MRDTIYRDDIVKLLKQRSIQLRGVYGDLGGAASGAAKLIMNFPSAQPEPCEYCHEDSGGYVKPIEKNCHAFICFGMDGWELSLKANGWHGSAKIKYCPMCGRRLEK